MENIHETFFSINFNKSIIDSHDFKPLYESFVHRDYVRDDTYPAVLPSLLNLQRFLCIWSLKNLWFVILHFCFVKYSPASTFSTHKLTCWLLNSPYSFGLLNNVKVNVSVLHCFWNLESVFPQTIFHKYLFKILTTPFPFYYIFGFWLGRLVRLCDYILGYPFWYSVLTYDS